MSPFCAWLVALRFRQLLGCIFALMRASRLGERKWPWSEVPILISISGYQFLEMYPNGLISALITGSMFFSNVLDFSL